MSLKFPPNLSDTSKLVIELYKELISDEEEWKLFRELNLLNVDDGACDCAQTFHGKKCG